MTINTLSRNKMKISLSATEVDSLFGGYDRIDYSDPLARTALHSLLRDALPQYGFSLDCQRLLIEVKPQPDDGCAIYLTKLYEGNAKRLRRVVAQEGFVLSFEDCESMLRAICTLYLLPSAKPARSALYRFSNSYRLILYSGSGGTDFIPRIEEYCSNITHSQYAAAAIEEYGVPVCRERAIERIGSAFVQQNEPPKAI